MTEFTNNDRAELALTTLQSFADKVYHLDGDRTLSDPDAMKQALGDLLCDVLHLVGADMFEHCLELAQGAYMDEIAEEEATVDPQERARRMAEYLDETRALVAEHGWAVQGVFSVAGEENPGPNFLYTVGLSTYDAPEFIVFGVAMEVGHAVLNGMGAKVRDGARFQAGDLLDDVLDGYNVRLVEVHDTTEHLTVANRVYGLPDPVRALQIVLPDKAGRFPWDPDCELSWQPVLGTGYADKRS